MTNKSAERQSLFSTPTELVIWLRGPNCISDELAQEVLSMEDQFKTNWLGRRVLQVASQRFDPNYFIEIEPMPIGETDSIAQILIQAREQLSEIGEVEESIAGYAIKIYELMASRKLAPRHT